MCGPDGLGGPGRVSAAFGQDEAAAALPPGPVLAALAAGQALGRYSTADRYELTGVLQAARRVTSWSDYLQTVVIAELGQRRQAEFAAAKGEGQAGALPG